MNAAASALQQKLGHVFQDEGLLLAGGGHAMAAGLTVRAAQIPELRAFLTERTEVKWGVGNADRGVISVRNQDCFRTRLIARR